ncbi:MAG: SIS domain-containing protein [Candidatus Njordarchaeota archaeon]
MIGIGGFFSITADSIASGKIKEALDILRHYGRDGFGIAYYDESHRLKTKKSLSFENIIQGLTDSVKHFVLGISRYAIYGRPALPNVPPFFDCNKRLICVARGALLGHSSIRTNLIKSGHVLVGKECSEILAHAVGDFLIKGHSFDEAVVEVYKKIGGTFSAVFLDTKDLCLYLLSKGIEEYFGVSDRSVVIASEYDIITKYSADRVEVYGIKNGVLRISAFKVDEIVKNGDIHKIENTKVSRVPGGFDYYMEREIHEIPNILTLQKTVHNMEYIRIAAKLIADARRVYMIGSGSSYNSVLYGAYVLNDLSGIYPIAQNATEFIYFFLNKVKAGDVIIANSQSGETSDVLRAVSKSRMRGAIIIGVLNMLGTPLMFASNVYIPIVAGVENAVPATKTFVAQLVTFLRLALKVAEENDNIKNMRESLNKLPRMAEAVLEKSKVMADIFSDHIRNSNDVFVLGRGMSFPIALEVALKLKEVAQIHAEGMDAGEFRHGSKTLLEFGYPAIIIVPQDIEAREDTYSLVEEISKRVDMLIVTTDDDPYPERFTKYVIKIPTVPRAISPVLYVLPLQILALYLGVKRGRPIDRPHGLEKYVVEKPKI